MNFQVISSQLIHKKDLGSSAWLIVLLTECVSVYYVCVLHVNCCPYTCIVYPYVCFIILI